MYDNIFLLFLGLLVIILGFTPLNHITQVLLIWSVGYIYSLIILIKSKELTSNYTSIY